ncbi:DNA gyrase subunit A [Thalassospira xianhensis]|uniref:DNA gyrase subunit A n=1 Tax=Thalassospira xianhensis TaxID=478503 RepID=UPI000DED5864|nr:DNA gyrase subunit A [Thalassospira xianhensis]
MGLLDPSNTVEARTTINLEDEMRTSYLNYAMSVIVSRALPDVRDGLKPVHRRILYTMDESGVVSSKPHKKSARVVGEVMGKYHPHGDSAIYDSMVRMAQPFQMSSILIDGQGNFGSIDGDSPAAMRYTEARMSPLAESMVADMIVSGGMEAGQSGYAARKSGRDTVDFIANYDGTLLQPTVLPTRFPNVLVNGGAGIAVGMATNIPTHNLGEVIDATLAMIDNPSLTLDEFMAFVPGPDFPTGGVVMGAQSIRTAMETGRGSLYVSGVAHIEENGGRQRVVLTELPYAVNKEELVSRIGALVTGVASDKKKSRTISVIPDHQRILGVSDLRDESDGTGIRVVIDLKRDTDPNLVLSKLRKYTRFCTTFSVNATCLNAYNQPEVMGAMRMVSEFIQFRKQVVRRRTIYLLDEARDELAKQIGLYAARSCVEEVVKIIRSSKDPEAARIGLMAMSFATNGELGALIAACDPDVAVPEFFTLSMAQAKAVLALRLSSLTALELDKISERIQTIIASIRGYEEVLNNEETLKDIIRNELAEVRAKFSTPRRTRIESFAPGDVSEDELVEQKAVFLTLTGQGYVKITPLDAYREQSRGGKGRAGMETKEDDFVQKSMVCNTRTPLLFFTSRGIAHTVRAYKLPETAPNSRGKPIVNFINLRPGETIAAVLPLPEDKADFDGKFMMFVTDRGEVRRNRATDFSQVNKSGKIAMKLEDANGQPTAALINVLLAEKGDDIALSTSSGRSVRFPITDVRVFSGRNSTGNKGVALTASDRVVGATILRHFDATAAEREAYLSGGSCVIKHPDKEDEKVTLSAERLAEMAEAEQYLLTVTERGYGKRFSSYDFRTTSRGTQGVKAGTFSKVTGDLVACACVLPTDSLVLVTDGGQVIRTPVSTQKENGQITEIRVMSRTARGVKLFEIPDDQRIVDVAIIANEEEPSAP